MRGRPIPEKVKRAVRDRSGGICEAWTNVCNVDASDFHHMKSRRRGGSNDAINLLHCCASCHDSITTHRAGTKKFRTHSWQDEGKTEVDCE